MGTCQSTNGITYTGQWIGDEMNGNACYSQLKGAGKGFNKHDLVRTGEMKYSTGTR